ncbi:hypothetical protein ACLOJK_025639, partial [Asimina triloba]
SPVILTRAERASGTTLRNPSLNSRGISRRCEIVHEGMTPDSRLTVLDHPTGENREARNFSFSNLCRYPREYVDMTRCICEFCYLAAISM